MKSDTINTKTKEEITIIIYSIVLSGGIGLGGSGGDGDGVSFSNAQSINFAHIL